MYALRGRKLGVSARGMDKSCSFHGIGLLQCGESRGGTVTSMLTECNADVTRHLSACHLSRTKLKEFQLILLRAGHFDVADEQIAVMRICPSHRNNLGRFWRAPRTCQHPLHSGTVRKYQERERFLTLSSLRKLVNFMENVCKLDHVSYRNMKSFLINHAKHVHKKQ